MKLPIGFRRPEPTRPLVLETADVSGQPTDQSAVLGRQTVDPRGRRFIGEIKRNGMICAYFVAGCDYAPLFAAADALLCVLALLAAAALLQEKRSHEATRVRLAALAAAGESLAASHRSELAAVEDERDMLRARLERRVVTLCPFPDFEIDLPETPVLPANSPED